MKNKITFFKEAIKNIRTSGTVVPSSKFLVKKMLAGIDFKTARVLVEFGPGSGIITREMLKRMHPEAQLFCFEINDVFFEYLSRDKHPQLTILKTSATEIRKVIQKHGFDHVDYVVSSLPLAIMPPGVSLEILENSYIALKNKGEFIQYQYSLQNRKDVKKVFNKQVSIQFVTLNIPPAFVYFCKKVQ
ncbi:MAG: ribosomal RNA adenine dimethylase [Flavobacteriaceae bacterium]|nr:MAG: ribosomal RNA adenine dimethylase [Flavobacteriaceae bacterium]